MHRYEGWRKRYNRRIGLVGENEEQLREAGLLANVVGDHGLLVARGRVVRGESGLWFPSCLNNTKPV